MNTLPRWNTQQKFKVNSTKSPRSIRKTLRGWKVALIGLLLICVAIISGCASKSNLPVSPQDQTVDASLMVKSNYTKQLLDVLSK